MKNNNMLEKIEEKPIKEGIVFKKRILSISKRDSNIIKKNSSIKNMKKNFLIKLPNQNIKNNETFNESIFPIEKLKQKQFYYNKLSNISTTDRNNESKEKLNSDMNSKFKYHKKLNIESPKIILDLGIKDNEKYKGHISPRIPKIIFGNGDWTLYHGKIVPHSHMSDNVNKKYNNKYNKIIINNIFGINKEKENDINYTNINYNVKQNNKKKKSNNNLKTNEIPKSNNIKKRNNLNNYSKQVTHFALHKFNNNSGILRRTSPKNNKEIINKTIQKYFISSNKDREINKTNVTNNSRKKSRTTFDKLNIKNILKYKNGNLSKISLKHNINNNKTKKLNLENLIILQNNNKSNNIKENKNQKLVTEEIKIKNSKLIDYINKSKLNKRDDNLNSSYNNLNFNMNNTFDKQGKKRRNLSFNIFNNYNNFNPLLYNNDDSCTNNNISLLSNGSILCNNNAIKEKRVLFNRKIGYKRNKFSGDYFELAKICVNQEKIISDLVKNVQNLNNQICDKDLCINELNNQLYSIKYDLLNTLQKTNGKS